MASAITALRIGNKLDTFVSREYIMNRERQNLLVGTAQSNRLFETFKIRPELINDKIFDTLMEELKDFPVLFNKIKQRDEFVFDFKLIEVLVYCARYYWTEKGDLIKNQSINENIRNYILSASEIFFNIYENILAILNTHSLNYIINLYEYDVNTLALNMINKKYLREFLTEVKNNYYLFRFMCLTFLDKKTVFFNLKPNEINNFFNDNKDRSGYSVQSLLEELAVLFSEEELVFNIITINNERENKLAKKDLIDIKKKLNLVAQYFYKLSEPDSACYLTYELPQKSIEVAPNRGEKKAAVSAESVAQAEEARRSLLQTEEEEKKKKEEQRRKKREKKKRQRQNRQQRRQAAREAQAAQEAQAARESQAAKEAQAAREAAAAVAREAQVAKEVQPEAKEDAFKVRREDIKSYLTEKNIHQGRDPDEDFENQEDTILQFIRKLNIKLARTQYKLVITGGYASKMQGGNNKTGDVDMVLCHNDDVRTARSMIAQTIYQVMSDQEMDMGKNSVLVLSPYKEPDDPTHPVKIIINGVQAIDITFKSKNDDFCEKIEVIKGFLLLKPDFMLRNLMEITNNFRQKRIDGIISHDGKLVSWLHQMDALNKIIKTRKAAGKSTVTNGGRKTRRKRRKKTKKRVVKRKKTKKRVKKRKKTRSRKK